MDKRILWVDDEVELLEPHLLFLRQRGYDVDTTTNGDDALELMRRRPYDLVLLDEQMPGRRGLEVLGLIRKEEPHARVVMVTKSEEDRTLEEAIGRRVDEYLVKPASPRQVLSVVTRLLEGSQLRQQQAAQDFAARFLALSQEKDAASTWQEYFTLYSELTDWDLRLTDAGEAGLVDSARSLMVDLRREFGAYVRKNYASWVAQVPVEGLDRPPLSTDVVRRWVRPRMGEGPLLFVIIDCLRLDQWRAMRPLLADLFDIDEELYASILPTATPYSRNALFSGQYTDSMAKERPEWWATEEGSLNAFEDELFRAHLKEITGRDVPIHYEKVFTDETADDLIARV
ncbi:MAG: response regulator, partial [Gemmatimonadetes bacterium]|nr:response regulator [Gemmatimonadota bacterium]